MRNVTNLNSASSRNITNTNDTILGGTNINISSDNQTINLDSVLTGLTSVTATNFVGNGSLLTNLTLPTSVNTTDDKTSTAPQYLCFVSGIGSQNLKVAHLGGFVYYPSTNVLSSLGQLAIGTVGYGNTPPQAGLFVSKQNTTDTFSFNAVHIGLDVAGGTPCIGLCSQVLNAKPYIKFTQSGNVMDGKIEYDTGTGQMNFFVSQISAYTPLQVKPSGIIFQGNDNTQLQLISPDAKNNYLELKRDGVARYWRFGTDWSLSSLTPDLYIETTATNSGSVYKGIRWDRNGNYFHTADPNNSVTAINWNQQIGTTNYQQLQLSVSHDLSSTAGGAVINSIVGGSSGGKLMLNTTGGNVGINTTTPSKNLHINGNVLVGDVYTATGGLVSGDNSQFIIGGTHNSATYYNIANSVANNNAGGLVNRAKLLITGYNNDPGNDGFFVYPILIEDENGNADFFVRSVKDSNGGGTCFCGNTLDVGGALKIGIMGKDAGAMSSAGRRNLFIQTTFGVNNGNGGWWIGTQNEPVTTNDNDLYFEVEYSNGNTHVAAIILDQRTNVFMNFTGQHRCKYDDYNENRIGLIVKSTGTYTNLDNSNEPTINDSLCNIELTSKKNDKSVFGVISSKEDNGKGRTYCAGNFVSVYEVEDNLERTFINSVGEGSVWVCNINGNLENGDLITTSNILGYGMKQDDDLVRGYTLGKITQDCDFNNIHNWNTSRKIDINGNVIEDGEYIAVFVGCVYYCG